MMLRPFRNALRQMMVLKVLLVFRTHKILMTDDKRRCVSRKLDHACTCLSYIKKGKPYLKNMACLNTHKGSLEGCPALKSYGSSTNSCIGATLITLMNIPAQS